MNVGNPFENLKLTKKVFDLLLIGFEVPNPSNFLSCKLSMTEMANDLLHYAIAASSEPSLDLIWDSFVLSEM